ncbi:hypothetical protein CBR_g25753 [Chara braunii]|uniref:VHS domain-containing protein n=1 Tax=Chara braunii TaxID=69332 RepID=A0A388L6F4_CHABU|nr:hypothetical protein CBR_g25753 [Chara braunii]|eukprot:GBG77822.1 hypothetical protein CBR_g25753 [Chara braunii]
MFSPPDSAAEMTMQAVEAFKRSRMIEGATSDDHDVTPVYKLEEISELLRTSPGDVVGEITDHLMKRLDHKSPVVKQKVLRVMKFVVGKGGPELKIEIQRHSATIRSLCHYRGNPDPLRGDALNKAVRDAAHDAIQAMFTEAQKGGGSLDGGSGLGKRLQGFGSAGEGIGIGGGIGDQGGLSGMIGLGSSSLRSGLEIAAEVASNIASTYQTGVRRPLSSRSADETKRFQPASSSSSSSAVGTTGGVGVGYAGGAAGGQGSRVAGAAILGSGGWPSLAVNSGDVSRGLKIEDRGGGAMDDDRRIGTIDRSEKVVGGGGRGGGGSVIGGSGGAAGSGGGLRSEHVYSRQQTESLKQIEELTDSDIQKLTREECQTYLMGIRRAPNSTSGGGSVGGGGWTSLEELTDATLKQRVREERRFNHHAKEKPAVKDRPLEELTDADIKELTREECRRYLKEKGMRKPSWNKAQAMQQLLSLKGLLPIASSGGSICIPPPRMANNNASQGASNGKTAGDVRSSGGQGGAVLPPFPTLPANFSPPIFFPVPCVESSSMGVGGGGGGGASGGGSERGGGIYAGTQVMSERQTATLLPNVRVQRASPDRGGGGCTVPSPPSRDGRPTSSLSMEAGGGASGGTCGGGVGGLGVNVGGGGGGIGETGVREPFSIMDETVAATNRPRSLAQRFPLPSLNALPGDSMDTDDASLSLSMRVADCASSRSQ